MPASNDGGFPTDGSLVASVPPTTPGAWWFHSFREEIRNAIIALGASPEFTQTDQLALALLAALANTEGSIRDDLATVALTGDYAELKNTPVAVPPGSMLAFAGSAIPGDFLLANGAAVSRTSYAGLFAVIGVTYGAGDGATTFNLPDSRGVLLRGLDNGRGLDAGRILGSYQADAYASRGHGINDPGHAHNVADPGHGHGVNDPGHQHNIVLGNIAGGNSGPGGAAAQYGNANGNNNWGPGAAPAASGIGIGIDGSGTGIGIYGSGTGISIQAAGGTETRGKNVSVNYIIKY